MEQKTIQEPARRVPVVAEADVVVVGGGTAGVIAALAAAKNGAKTVLVEQLGHLGGTLLTGGLALHGFFNNYALFPDTEKTRVVDGLPEMFLQRLVEAGGSYGHIETEVGLEIEPDIPTFDPVILQKLCFELIREYGVRLFTRTWFADALVEDDAIHGIVVESKAGRGAILAKVVIDATGDGDVAARAGAPFIEETDLPKRHPTGLIFGLGGTDLQRAYQFGLEHDCIHRLTRAHPDTPQEAITLLWLDFDQLPGWEEDLKPWEVKESVFGSTRNDVVHYVNCVNVKSGRNLDPEDALVTELKLWDKAFAVTAFLNKHVQGFEDAFITSFAPLLGVRHTRIVQCEYEITFDDIRQGRTFPDEIGRYAWTDIHTPEHQPLGGGAYGIPYRALVPRRIDQLLVAGRMITAEVRAHQSTRNTVHCMVQGEAVGTAAALAAREGVSPRDLDTSLLQDTLLQNGVILAKE